MKFSPPTNRVSVRSERSRCVVPTIRDTTIAILAILVAGHTCVEQAFSQGLRPDDRQSTVDGTVVNAVTREPIGRALVSSTDNRFAMLTDSDGHFEFPLPKVNPNNATGVIFAGRPGGVWYGIAGNGFWLTARKPGFLDDPYESRQGEAAPGSEITISLMPEALIRGRVSVSTTDAAAGVNVQIFSRQVQDGLLRWIPGVSVHTNSAGEFRFAELLPGTYRLVTHELMDNDPVASVPGGQLYGYPPVYYPGVTDFAAAATIQLTAGQTFQADLSLTRKPYYSVKIPVATGETNGGMNLQVSKLGHGGPGYSLGHNFPEQRIEGLLPNGNYVVEARTYGLNSATGIMSITVAGAPIEGPAMTLSRNGSISLEVKEEFHDTKWRRSMSWNDGKHTFTVHGPRAYLQARVEAADDFEQQGGSLRMPIGPNDDSLVIENLRPGRYWLRLNSSRGYVAAATMGGVDLLHEPLVVGSGSSAPIEITMRDDTGEIEGTVADLAARQTMGPAFVTGLVTSHAWVYIVPLPDSPGQFQQIAVSEDGRFNSQTMAPGGYRVLALKNQQPNLPYRDAEAMRAYETKGQVVHLAPGQKATLQVQIISSSE
jgi:hypothetical protein